MAKTLLQKSRTILAVFLFLVVIAGVSVLSGAKAASAAYPDDFKFESLETKYFLDRDEDGNALLTISETFVAYFPHLNTHRGIIRAIPLKYDRARLDPTVHVVSDESGSPRTYTEYEEDGFLLLRIGDPDIFLTGEQTYKIEYSVKNAIKLFEEAGVQEFYWDVNGTGWAQPFDTVTAEINLGPGLSESLTGEMSCYEGSHGATKACSIENSEGLVFAATDALLQPQQTMTFAIGFHEGTFAPQILPFETPEMHYLRFVLPWVTPIVLLPYTVWAFIRRAKTVFNAPGRGLIVPRYKPEPGMNPALAGAVLNGPEDRKTIPSQLIGFVVKKSAKVSAETEKPNKNLYTVTRLDDGVENLDPTELRIYHTILGGGKISETTLFNPKDPKIGRRLEKAKKMLPEILDQSGLVNKLSPKIPTALAVTMTLLVLTHFVAFIAAIFVDDFVTKPIVFGLLAGVFVWVLSLIAARTSRRLTPNGALAKEALLGLKEYMRLAETDRLRLLQSPETAERTPSNTGSETASTTGLEAKRQILQINEGLLPYAVIFGLEKEWQKVLEVNAQEVSGSLDATRDPLYNAGVLVGFSNFTASKTFLTQDPASSSSGKSSWGSSGGSSSSSGSSGGGYAGGGGGGGGGGGW